MKKTTFVTLFIGTHVFLLGLQINTHSKLMKASYIRQRLEQEKEVLISQKQNLTQQLYASKNLEGTQKYATSQNMKKIELSQLKKLPNV